MKQIYLLLLILFISANAQTLGELTESDAGDVWHLTGSTLGVLLTQRAFEMDWESSALIILAIGAGWEVMDEIAGSKNGMWDPKGFSAVDMLFNFTGVLWSYPLRYEYGEVRIAANKITLSFKL